MNAYYKGPIDVIRKVLKDEGLKGLYRGQTTMIIREIPLFATQFSTYFYSRKFFAKNIYHCKIDDLPTLPILFSGGLSGLACWCVAYPLVSILLSMMMSCIILGHGEDKIISRKESIVHEIS